MKQYHWTTEDWGTYVLRDPNGESITSINTTEAPEDVTPGRDLDPIVTELNRLLAQLHES